MKAPKFPSFIRTSSNKQFEMHTRYYSERKERIEEARELAQTKSKGGIEKGHFSSAWKKKSTSADGNSTLRVLVIIAILCFIAYWILKF